MQLTLAPSPISQSMTINSKDTPSFSASGVSFFHLQPSLARVIYNVCLTRKASVLSVAE